MNILSYINDIISKIEKGLIIFSLSVMVVLTFSNVMLRALYTHANIEWANNLIGRVDWSEPMSRLMVLWVAFLGASLLTRDNRHIRIEIPGIMGSPFWSAMREVIISMGCAVICIFILKASIDYLSMEKEYGSGVLIGVPMWIYQIIIPSGFSIMLFRFIINGIKNLISIFSGKLS